MKEKLKKLKVRNIIIIILLMIFLFSLFKIVTYYKDMHENKIENEEIIEEYVKIEVDEEANEIVTIDFDKLKEINKDIIGWIRYNDNKINYPVVHTVDNDYYLLRTFTRKSNQSGTIFMDYRNKSFDDRNVVIFGHALFDNTMFGSLKEMLKEGYFDDESKHYIEIINADNETLTYEIFSYYIIEKEEYYITTSFDSDASFNKFLKTIKSRSKKKFDVELSSSDKILTLSTCYGTTGTTKRQVVHAKLINTGIEEEKAAEE